MLREAEDRDIPQIAFVHIESMRANPCNGIFGDYMNRITIGEYSRIWSEKFKNLKPLASRFVAECNSKIIGFGEVGPSGDKDVDDKTGSIYGLYLLPGYQGKGIGMALQKKGLEYLEDNGFESVTVWTQEDNYLAIKTLSVEDGWAIDGFREGIAGKANYKEIRFRKHLKNKIKLNFRFVYSYRVYSRLVSLGYLICICSHGVIR